jgi:nucleoid-associated protein YgaU
MTISLPFIRLIRGVSALLTVLLVTACGDFGGGAEDRDPNMKRARERRAVGDFTGALEAYQKALDKRPGVARIHWDMATVYDQHLTNELRAIYHYERYLELDPKAERRQLVEQSIGLAKLSYAVSLPDRTSESVQEIARLRREIDSLRKLITESREKIAELTAPPPVAPVASAIPPPAPAAARVAAVATSATPAAAPPSTGKTEAYVVQPGDTMSRIAKKMYNDANKWDVIYQANRGSLKRPQDIKVGQTLIIPR